MPLLIVYLSKDQKHTDGQKRKLTEAYNDATNKFTEHNVHVFFVGVTKFRDPPGPEEGAVLAMLFQPGGYSKRTKEKLAQAFYKATKEILDRGLVLFFRDADSQTGSTAEKDHLGRVLVTH